MSIPEIKHNHYGRIPIRKRAETRIPRLTPSITILRVYIPSALLRGRGTQTKKKKEKEKKRKAISQRLFVVILRV